MTTATSVAQGGAAVGEKVRPRDPVVPAVVPTASAKSTPIKSPEKKKSKGDTEMVSEKEPVVKDLSRTFDRVAGDAAAETIDLDSPMTTSGVGFSVNSECITWSYHMDVHLMIQIYMDRSPIDQMISDG